MCPSLGLVNDTVGSDRSLLLFFVRLRDYNRVTPRIYVDEHINHLVTHISQRLLLNRNE